MTQLAFPQRLAQACSASYGRCRSEHPVASAAALPSSAAALPSCTGGSQGSEKPGDSPAVTQPAGGGARLPSGQLDVAGVPALRRAASAGSVQSDSRGPKPSVSGQTRR